MKNNSKISAADFLPQKMSLRALKAAAEHCQGCHLYKKATQTVFGDGKSKARIIMVGEIPGQKEDETGIPFTGPAGMLLRDAIEDSKLDLDDIYFTNVVKHFKFTLIGNRRLHRSPVGTEIKACMPWLDSEIKVIDPQIIICLGSVAAKALIDKKFSIQREHGKWFKFQETKHILGTYHPSAILRAPDHDARHELKKLLIKDMRKVSYLLNQF